MEDHDVRGAARLPVGEAPPVAREIGVQLERVDVGGVPPGAERVPHQARGVADRVPAVQRGDPLVDPHGSSGPHCSLMAGALRVPSEHGPQPVEHQRPEVGGADLGGRALLRGDERAPQVAAVGDAVEHLGHQLRALVLQQQPAAAQRLAHGAGIVGDHRQAEEHRLLQRHPEALVLRQAQEDVGEPVVGVELVVVDLAGEDHLVHAQLAHQLLQPVEVALEAPVVAHQQQAALRPHELLEEREAADEVVDLLVRDDAPDEQHVGAAVVVEPPHQRRRRPLVERQVQHDRQHGRAREARLLQLLAVELAVAERELGARGEGGELAAPVVAQAREVRVEAEEEVRRRDVVVDDHQPVGGVVDQAAGGAADREVEDADGLGGRDLPVLEERARQVRDARVHQLREDVRLVAGGAQLALDRERLVADRVAVGERSEELVDLHRPGSRGPLGAAPPRRPHAPPACPRASWRAAPASRRVPRAAGCGS